jgi:hypothetical protein
MADVVVSCRECLQLPYACNGSCLHLGAGRRVLMVRVETTNDVWKAIGQCNLGLEDRQMLLELDFVILELLLIFDSMWCMYDLRGRD